MWTGMIRVDGAAYTWLSPAPLDPVDATVAASISHTNTTAVVVTPTRTIITSIAGPVALNVTFFDPIEVRKEKG